MIKKFAAGALAAGMCANCSSDLQASIQVSPPEMVATAGKPIYLNAEVKGPAGDSEYRWSIVAAPSDCQTGIRTPAAPVTEYVPPAACAGAVGLKLTVTRGRHQVEVTKTIYVSAAGQPPPAPGAGDAPAAAGQPAAAELPVSFDSNRVFTFQDAENGDMRAEYRKSGGTLHVELSSREGRRGFAGVCIEPRQQPWQIGAYSHLELTARNVTGDHRLHVKLERTSSSCPDCQCRLHNEPASSLPGPGGKARLPLDLCPQIKQVGRICFGAASDEWGERGRVAFDVSDMKFVRAE